MENIYLLYRRLKFTNGCVCKLVGLLQTLRKVSKGSLKVA